MSNGRRAERPSSYSPRGMQMVGRDSHPSDFRRGSSRNAHNSVAQEIAPNRTEFEEMRQSQQTFVANAIEMVRVIGETMIQLKAMQEQSLMVINEKTEVLKQESDVLGRHQQTSNVQLSQLSDDRSTLEANGNVMVQIATARDDHLEKSDNANVQIAHELQRASSGLQNLQGNIDNQRYVMPATAHSGESSEQSK